MKDIILIKGNKHGLNIILDDTAPFTLLKDSLFKKLNESKKFFGNSRVSIQFEGRSLLKEEKDELVDIIQSASDLDIVCVIDDELSFATEEFIEQDPKISDDELMTESEEQLLEPSSSDRTAIFHKGTLRSGQEIVTDTSIIIMGNVHNGATVIANGNVIVIGKLSGYVHAGKGGNKSAFVVALNMSPTQLRIADVFGRAADKKGKKILPTPQIAFVEDDRIVIESINRNIYDQLNQTN